MFPCISCDMRCARAPSARNAAASVPGKAPGGCGRRSIMPKPAADVRRIFDQALEIDSSEERARFLAGACGSNAAIRDEIASLFSAFDSAGNFLESALIASTQMEGAGSLIGSYKLLEKIGEGGMGAVYMAEQTGPIRRKVALKIIKPGMDSRQVISARFEAERCGSGDPGPPRALPRSSRPGPPPRPRPLFRHGAGGRRSHHRLLRQGQSEAPGGAAWSS